MQSTAGPDLGLSVALPITNTAGCHELEHTANTEGGQGKHKGIQRDYS